MKKHLLGLSMGVAACALAGAAFAAGSNKSYTDQSGTGGSIVINQNSGDNGRVVTAGDGGNNYVGYDGHSFQQSGYGNALTVNQTGTSNALGFDVGSQAGTNNTANVLQQGRDGRVELLQNGSNNGQVSGRVFLDANDNSTASNLIKQDSNALRSTIDLRQDGSNGGEFSLIQSGADNRQTVRQSGDGNQVATNQASTTNNSSISVTQTGTSLQNQNYASAYQNDQAFSSITVTQAGNNNRVDAGQQNYFNSGTNVGNVIQATQYGNNNKAYTFQYDGNSNQAYSSQYGSAGTAAIFQRQGDGNYASIAQDSGSYNAYASLQQAGTGNYAISSQGGENNALRGPGSDFSYPYQQAAYQNGNYNQLFNTQRGSGNTADVLQQGNSNYLRNDQYGSRGSMTSSQVGNSNQVFSNQTSGSDLAMLMVTQNGNSNYVNSTQDGIRNQATLLQSGDNNVINGQQIGQDNHATVSQYNNSNTVGYGQSGSGNRLTVTQR
ncbi:hypothetical protein [Methylobacterium persicinum]|uniref:Curlin associated repeat-containing protein n=1 Tax=Methylobacterium persicinum TaxID=374426 RepID=A0ABU0HRQ7_9HYPH|nr:hypothetical protein [Methylobacterium persicinum]MDQ0445023.1 hypothetical protein [Methylobacterium persicinum]GJE37428.1 hypothetical protein KHHGKMAE_1486 [Methylobacterium persicinum]